MLTYGSYGIIAALLGIWTSLSPCPMATNIAAISYIGRKVDDPRRVLLAGLLYTLGRCLLYLVLAMVVVAATGSSRVVSLFLQKYVHLLLGPTFLLLGMFLVGLVTFAGGGISMSAGLQKRIDAMGIWGAPLLGILFALSFCPTSAAWFGALVALIMGTESSLVTMASSQVGVEAPTVLLVGGVLYLPVIYGIGTGLPVLAVALLMAYSANSVGRAYNILGKVDWWARMTTGWIFIALGTAFSLKYAFLIDIPRI